MQKELVNLTLKFLERVDLKGNEAPAFVQCVTALQMLILEKESVSEKKESKTKK